MAFYRASIGGGGGGSEGSLVQYAYKALNATQTYSGLTIGKTYTYFCGYNGTRACAVASVTGGTFTEKQNVTASSGSYSVTWIVPISSTITITQQSTSSGGVLKLLFD